MTKRRILALSLLLLLLAACGATPAGTSLTNPIIPRLTTDTGWVVDTTGQLSSDTMSQLQSLTLGVKDDGYQMGIFIFSNCNCEEVPFATEVANTNGIGVAGLDNGITIVVFLDKEGSGGDKPSIGVAIGSGLEGLMNDAKVGRLLDATFVPSRADGQWQTGLVSFVTATRAVLNGANADDYHAPPGKTLDPMTIILIIIVVIILLSADGIFFRFQITILLIELAPSLLGGGGKSSGGGAAR